MQYQGFNKPSIAQPLLRNSDLYAGCWLMNETGGIIVRDKSKTKNDGTILVDNLGMPQYSFVCEKCGSFWGRGQSNSAARHFVGIQHPSLHTDVLSEFTILIRARLTSLTPPRSDLLENGDAGWVITSRVAGNKSFGIYLYNGGWTLTTVNADVPNYLSEQWINFAVTYKNPNVRVYADNVMSALTNVGTLTQTGAYGTGNITLGGHAGAGFQCPGLYNYCIIMKRALSIDQVRSYQHNPFQDFGYPRYRKYAKVAAAGDSTGTWTSPIFQPTTIQTKFPDDKPWGDGTHSNTEVNGSNQVILSS